MAPTRSPDIIPTDFFLLGNVKNCVHETEVPGSVTLQQCIRDAIGTITPDMLQNMWEEIEYRLVILCVSTGAHVEVI